MYYVYCLPFKIKLAIQQMSSLEKATAVFSLILMIAWRQKAAGTARQPAACSMQGENARNIRCAPDLFIICNTNQNRNRT